MNISEQEAAMILRNFKLSEFDSRDLPGSGNMMQKSTLIKLQNARTRAGIPFVINSGYRTPAHNRAVGGSANSAHTRGHAVDIRARTANEKYKIVKACMAAGFTRIGIYKNFVHVDDDPSLPQNVIW